MPRVRRLLLFLALGAGLLLALALALPWLISLDAIRSRILTAAETSLGRKVEAGKIRLEIFSGLGAGIEKFTVRNGPGWETPALASIDRLSVKLAFWPLLSRRIEVRRIVLEGATVAVERDPSGTWNIADLLASPPSGGTPSAAPAAALLVARLQIARGRLLFVDRKVVPGRTVSLSLDDLTGEISDVGAASAARFQLAARFLAETGRNLSLEGSLGPPVPGKGLGEGPLAAKFAAKGLELSRLRPYFGAAGEVDPGVLSVEGTVEGAMLGVLKLAVHAALVPPASASAVPPVEGRLAMTLDGPAGSLAIASSPVTLAKLPLTVEGRIDGLRGAMRVDLRLATPGDVPLDTVTGLPGLSGSLPAGVKLSGRTRLEASIAGPSSDLQTRAAVTAAPLGVTRNGEPLFAAPALRATLASRGKSPVTGRITADSGKLQKLPFEDLSADWSWHEGSLVLAPSLRAFGGSLQGRVESDFSRPDAESRVVLDVQGVSAKPLVESLTTMRNVVAGVLTAKMSLASRGLTWDAFSKTARGDGRLSLADAELRTVELMPRIASTLSAVGTIAGFQVPASLESTRFSKLETELRLADGRLATPGLTLSGRDVAATADGSIGLDRTLSYTGRVTLGPAVVKSLGNTGRYLADPQGRLSLPFRASGPISAPKVVIDESVVAELAGRILARQAGERLQGVAGKALGDALQGGDGKTSEPLDILQRFLKAPSPTPTPR